MPVPVHSSQGAAKPPDQAEQHAEACRQSAGSTRPMTGSEAGVRQAAAEPDQRVGPDVRRDARRHPHALIVHQGEQPEELLQRLGIASCLTKAIAEGAYALAYASVSPMVLNISAARDADAAASSSRPSRRNARAMY